MEPHKTFKDFLDEEIKKLDEKEKQKDAISQEEIKNMFDTLNNINHPQHYNKPNRKECIEEMVDKFGLVETIIFCKLNIYKYLYRYDMKNGSEDIEKAANYLNMALNLWQRITE